MSNYKRHLYSLLLMLAFSSAWAQEGGRESWFTFTFDNDLFVGNDSGYTNGMTFSRFDVAFGQDEVEKGFLLKALAWTLPESKTLFGAGGYTLGQLMSTPEDISISDPPENDLPYAGLLFLSDSHTQRYEGKNYADRISTTIGVVGPWSQAESVQKGIHTILGNEEPMGWDTQIDNEPVFQLTRSRAWRTWHTKNGGMDVVNTAEVNIGTIESSLNTGVFLRAGRGLEQSYPSLLFFTSRITNPISPNGWQFFLGLRAGYTFNQIFLDGNTFRDSRSIDYDRNSLGTAAGYSYAFENVLLTFALYDLNVLGAESNENQSELTRFGTLTLAFRL